MNNFSGFSLLVLQKGCILFEFLLLIGNSYDHPWHAEVRLIDQYQEIIKVRE